MRKLSTFCLQITGMFCVVLLMRTGAFAHKQVVVLPLNSLSGKIKNNNTPCDASTAGTIRWNDVDFEGCDGFYWGRFSLTANVATVTSNTGRIWMDRNLGASRVAIANNDTAAYGDYYQWGRGADGHEKRNSGTTSNLSNSDTPGHDSFILASFDWRDPQNDNLWQGEFGINNPCPSGFRLPTETELDAEQLSWNSNTSAGAFSSPLKHVLAGFRYRDEGVFEAGSSGYYWSSTVEGDNSRNLYFYSGPAGMYSDRRSLGYSVRCIKD